MLIDNLVFLQTVCTPRDLCKLQAMLKREQEKLLTNRTSNIRHDDASTLTDETLVEIDRQARLDHLRELWDSLLKHCKQMETHDPAVAMTVGTSEIMIRCVNIMASIKEGLERSGMDNTSASTASGEGGVDLPTVVRQWARGVHHCGRALAELQQSESKEGTGQSSEEDNGRGPVGVVEGLGTAAAFAAQAQAVAKLADEHQLHATTMETLTGTLTTRLAATKESIKHLREALTKHTLTTGSNR